MLSNILVLLLLLPIAMALRYCRHHHVAGYFHDVVKTYRWSFWIRALIEVYLEVMIAAYI